MKRIVRSRFCKYAGFILWLSLLPVSVFGWGSENHKNISRTALSVLPKAELELLGSSADSLRDIYCRYPDMYRSAVNKVESDRVARYKPYVQLSLLNDTGNWHHIEEEESEIFFYVVYATMHEAVGQLKAGRTLDAAKYLGSLLHFIEDNGCPVHGVDNILLAELMPPPQKLVPFSLHGAVESPVFPLDITGYNSVVLGEDLYTAAHAFFARFLELRLNAKAQAVPILQSIYLEDEKTANTYRANAAVVAARLSADAIHTVCTLAGKK